MQKPLAALAAIFAILGGSVRAAPSCATNAHQRLAQVDPVAYNDIFVHGSADARYVYDRYITCQYSDLSFTSAAHEAIHIVTQDRGGYPMYDGTFAPHVQNFLPQPIEILGWIPSDNDEIYGWMKQSYITGRGGRQDLHSLVDELNAYSRGTHADDMAHVHQIKVNDSGVRLSLATMLLYVKLALQKMKENHPSDWNRFLASQESRSVAAVIHEAMKAHAEACDYPELGADNDRPVAKWVNSADHADAIIRLIGRGPYLWEDCAL